ncbi:neutral/alkaline non-lysosomal ceramidase N-terminal domain-containing protein [Inquilinus sp. YAF38]|uniref:neutral/alkaline non-lysosomal ceramidase N-terminal domain-containing protein n=1 Tax=Inquilinus sp. YAF38 TaxID=3233084 RepID=UPI003F9237D7
MSDLVPAGAAVIDVTPPAGLAMSGFAARASPATGVHDPLTVRAVAVGETALVVADAIGLHEDSCRRIRDRAGLADGHLIVAATHTHGGPVAMPGRLGPGLDPAWLQRLEDACVQAVAEARAARRPARLGFGLGADPGIARNRRHAGGPVDPALPVLRIREEGGAEIAVLASYALHPVVLGADNTLFTADYPGAVRRHLEAAHPRAVAIFLTGCTGDINTGHPAHASISTAPRPDRTFAEAERIGARIAQAALQTPEQPLGGTIHAASTELMLPLARTETEAPSVLADAWRREAAAANPARAALLRRWIDWAEQIAPRPLAPWSARVTLFDWGGARLVGLPGEIFAQTGLDLRRALDGDPLAGRTMTFGFADGCPGYIPPAGEYRHGGYEVEEAHRYYGLPAAFAPGAAERLVDAALGLTRR